MSASSASVRIDRRPDEVFAYLDDVTREQEWQPSLRSAVKEPAGPTAVGTRKRYTSRFLGKEISNTYVVTAWDPGRRAVYETTPDSTLEARLDIVCEPDGTGTRLTMTIAGRAKGALRLVPAAAVERAFRKDAAAALERLRERLEGRS